MRSQIAAVHASRQRGRFSEQSVLDICVVLAGEPAHNYLTGEPRRCTPHEDHQGIDIVCPSDVGDIFLQVKSSQMFARKFVKRARKHVIEVVVVHPTQPLVTTQRVIEALARARERLRRRERNRRS